MESHTTLVVHGANFNGNQVLYGGGGGMYCGTGVLVELVDVNFTSNSAREGGGLALVEIREASIEHCFYVTNEGMDGGGIYTATSTSAKISVHECVFERNNAGESSSQATTGFSLQCRSVQRRRELVSQRTSHLRILQC